MRGRTETERRRGQRSLEFGGHKLLLKGTSGSPKAPSRMAEGRPVRHDVMMAGQTCPREERRGSRESRVASGGPFSTGGAHRMPRAGLTGSGQLIGRNRPPILIDSPEGGADAGMDMGRLGTGERSTSHSLSEPNVINRHSHCIVSIASWRSHRASRSTSRSSARRRCGCDNVAPGDDGGLHVRFEINWSTVLQWRATFSSISAPANRHAEKVTWLRSRQGLLATRPPTTAFSYDSYLQRTATNPAAPEPARTDALIAVCEGDFNLMSGWFGQPGARLHKFRAPSR